MYKTFLVTSKSTLVLLTCSQFYVGVCGSTLLFSFTESNIWPNGIVTRGRKVPSKTIFSVLFSV